MDQDQTWDRLIDTQMQGSNSFCWALRRFRKSSNHKSSHQITSYVSVLVTEKIQVVVLENLIKWILQVKSTPCPTVWQDSRRFHGWIPIFDGQTVTSHFFHGWTSSKPHFFGGNFRFSDHHKTHVIFAKLFIVELTIRRSRSLVFVAFIKHGY